MRVRFLFDGRVTLPYLAVHALSLNPEVGICDARFGVRLNDDPSLPVAFSVTLGTHEYLPLLEQWGLSPVLVGGVGALSRPDLVPKGARLVRLLEDVWPPPWRLNDGVERLLVEYADSACSAGGPVVPVCTTVGCSRACSFCVVGRTLPVVRLSRSFVVEYVKLAASVGYGHVALCDADAASSPLAVEVLEWCAA